MQQPDVFEISLAQQRDDEKSTMLAQIRRAFPLLNTDGEVDTFEANGNYTLSFLNKIIANIHILRSPISSALQTSLPSGVNIAYHLVNKQIHLVNFLILVTHVRYRHTDYWHQDVKETLLEACQFLSMMALPVDFYQPAWHHFHATIQTLVEEHDTSPAEIWQQTVRFCFPEIRHIRINQDYFSVTTIIRDQPYNSGHKSLTTEIAAADSFFNQSRPHELTISTYTFVKYIGHFLAYARVTHRPAHIIDHLPHNSPQRIVATAVRTRLQQQSYMTATTQLTSQAFLDPQTHPIRIRRVNHEIEGTLLRRYAPEDPDIGIYVVTPTKMYFINGRSIVNRQHTADFQYLVCKETDIIQQMMELLNITAFNNNYLLTPAESKIFFKRFKHQRYKPQFITLAKNTALAEAETRFPEQDSRVLSISASPTYCQRVLNMSCFEIFAVTSFNPLHTIQLARHMVNDLDADDAIACGAIGADRFLQLRQMLTHTFETTARKIALQEELSQYRRQHYAYTTDIDDPLFWQQIRAQAPHAYIWVEAPTGLYCVKDLDPDNPAQQPDQILTHQLRRTVPQLTRLKKRYLKKGSVITANAAALALNAAKILKLAGEICARFLSANGPNKLIMHSTVPNGGHSFYTIFSKENGEVRVSIINGGTSEIHHHTHAESRPSGQFTDELHFARELNIRFTINNTSHRERLTHYIGQLMNLPIATHLGRGNGVKPTYDQAIKNAYLVPSNPGATHVRFLGLGDNQFVVRAGQGAPVFRYPRQDTGNCTVHNLINACIGALEYAEGFTGGFHVVMDVFKYALDQLTTDFKQAPTVAAPINPAIASNADDGDWSFQFCKGLQRQPLFTSPEQRRHLAEMGRELIQSLSL